MKLTTKMNVRLWVVGKLVQPVGVHHIVLWRGCWEQFVPREL